MVGNLECPEIITSQPQEIEKGREQETEREREGESGREREEERMSGLAGREAGVPGENHQPTAAERGRD